MALSKNKEAGGVIAYRPDIDGLRAVAVLAVVLFHIDHHLLPGGFAGVDIFFVISGFLITGIIFKGRERGSFSFAEFYRRRIKRIVPVLFCVLMTTLIAGNFILLPDDYIRLAESAVAAQFFAANVYFTYFLDTSYFAADASMEPLLHLWSLGVEEQFYLIWPLAFIGLCLLKSRGLRIALISACIVLSFGFAQWLLTDHAMFAYYMLPSRAGQLLFGALCFLVANNEKFRIPLVLNEILAAIGLLAIFFSLIYIQEDMGFPGINAIPVTLGSGLVILTASLNQTIVSRLLSFKILVLTGLISYSMYLWHWPILAFLKYSLSVLSWQVKLSSFVLIVLFSIASYRWVETPFKHSKRPFGAVFLRQFVLPSVIICAVAIGISATGGFGTFVADDQYRQSLMELDEGSQAGHQYPWVCQSFEVNQALLQDPQCRINSPVEPKALLWGDSNGSHFVGVLGEIAQEIGVSFRTIAHSSCPPLLESPEQFVPDRLKAGCMESNRVVVNHLDAFDVIILAGAWNTYLSKDAIEFEKALLQTVTRLEAMGKSVVLMGRVPITAKLDRNCTKKAVKLPLIDCASQLSSQRARVERNNKAIKQVALQSSAKYFDVSDFLCDENICSAVIDGKLAYHDSGHLSMGGSIKVGEQARQSTAVTELFLAAFAPLVQLNTGDRQKDSRLPWEDYQFGTSVFSKLSEFELLELKGMSKALDTDVWSTGRQSQNKFQKLNQVIVFSDDDSEANYSYKIDLLDLIESPHLPLGAFDYLIVDIDFELSGSNKPMFRFKGDRQCKQCTDIVVDADAMDTFQRKNKVLVSNQLISERSKLRLRVAISTPFIDSSLELEIFPAVADSEGVYSKQHTGDLHLKNIGLTIVSKNPKS